MVVWKTPLHPFLGPFLQAQMDAERAFAEEEKREHPQRFGGLQLGSCRDAA